MTPEILQTCKPLKLVTQEMLTPHDEEGMTAWL